MRKLLIICMAMWSVYAGDWKYNRQCQKTCAGFGCLRKPPSDEELCKQKVNQNLNCCNKNRTGTINGGPEGPTTPQYNRGMERTQNGWFLDSYCHLSCTLSACFLQRKPSLQELCDRPESKNGACCDTGGDLTHQLLYEGKYTTTTTHRPQGNHTVSTRVPLAKTTTVTGRTTRKAATASPLTVTTDNTAAVAAGVDQKEQVPVTAVEGSASKPDSAAVEQQPFEGTPNKEASANPEPATESSTAPKESSPTATKSSTSVKETSATVTQTSATVTETPATVTETSATATKASATATKASAAPTESSTAATGSSQETTETFAESNGNSQNATLSSDQSNTEQSRVGTADLPTSVPSLEAETPIASIDEQSEYETTPMSEQHAAESPASEATTRSASED